MPAVTVNVRYMVDDVDAAVDFYTTHLAFRLLSNSPPAFAAVARGDLQVLLSGPTSSAGRPMPDGQQPGPGGWNRIQFVVDDITSEVDRLRASEIQFRSEIITGPGGSQILFDDPSGKPRLSTSNRLPPGRNDDRKGRPQHDAGSAPVLGGGGRGT